MATNDLYELQVNMSSSGNRYQCTFGFRALTNTAAPSLLAADWLANLKTGFLNSISSSVNLDNIRVVDVKPGTSATYETASGLPTAGGSTGDMLAPQDAIVISWATALKGRSYRARTYYGPISEGANIGGVVQASWITGITTNFVTPMLTRYGPGGVSTDYEFGVISRFHAGIRRPTPVETQIVSGIVRPIIYTQRRRTLGVGA